MAKYTTQISSFFLFANAYKYFQGDRGSYKAFYKKCNRLFNSTADYYLSLWEEAANQINNTYLGKLFVTTNRLLKLLGQSEELIQLRHMLLDLRNTLCFELYQSTRTLLLNSLEIM